MKSKTVCIPRPTHTQATTVSSNGSVCWSDSGKMFPNRARAPKVRVPFFLFLPSEPHSLLFAFAPIIPPSRIPKGKKKNESINLQFLQFPLIAALQFSSIQFNSIQSTPVHKDLKKRKQKKRLHNLN